MRLALDGEKEVESIAIKLAVANPDDIRHCMELLLLRPVCSLYKEQKVQRIAKLFSSDVVAHVVDHFPQCVDQPSKFWKIIAKAVGSSPEKKTIAFQ